MRTRELILWLIIVALLTAFTTVYIYTDSKSASEYGNAKYQIQHSPDQGVSEGLVADCEVRFSRAVKEIFPAKDGDIAIQECRVRKTSEEIWEGAGEQIETKIK